MPNFMKYLSQYWKSSIIKSEPQNIEYQISNVEGWNRSPRRRRYNPYEPEAALDLFNYDRIHHSTLDVGRSLLDVHQFPFRFDRPFAWPAAGLKPET